MSWLMYATRSTMRTIFASSVSGSTGPGVREDPVADLAGQVQVARDPVGLLVVAELPSPKWPRERLVERVLAGVSERRVPQVVPEADRLGQVLVQAERSGDDPGDRGRLERVGHPRPVVVALRVDEDLRLPLQPPERLRVDDPVAVALERRPDAALVLLRARAHASRTSARRAARATPPRARGRGPRRRRQLSRPARASCSYGSPRPGSAHVVEALAAERDDQPAIRSTAQRLGGDVPRRAGPPVVVGEELDAAVLPHEVGHAGDECRLVEPPVRPLGDRVGLLRVRARRAARSPPRRRCG